MFGIPTLLCGVAAAVCRLNFPVLTAANYLAYPFQIALLWPFAKLGEFLFGAVQLAHGWAGVPALLLHTAVAWSCFAVPAGFAVYLAVRQVLRRHRRRMPPVAA